MKSFVEPTVSHCAGPPCEEAFGFVDIEKSEEMTAQYVPHFGFGFDYVVDMRDSATDASVGTFRLVSNSDIADGVDNFSGTASSADVPYFRHAASVIPYVDADG